MAQQEQNLREFVKRNKSQARVIAVTSGKGGVGKTSTSVNLAIALQSQGKRVVILDADLGLANVEVLFGLNSLYNLQHVIDGERRLSQVVVTAPGGVGVIPGTSGLAKLADLGDAARQNILSGLEELQNQADFIIIDTMAGIGQNAVSFVAAADEVILVSTPEPSSIVDAYAMVKTIFNRRDDAVIRLVANMVASQQQAAAVSQKLTNVTQQYLGRQISFLGFIPRDPHVSQAVMQSQPFVLRFPNSPASKSVQDLATRLINQRSASGQGSAGFLKRFAQTIGLASSA